MSVFQNDLELSRNLIQKRISLRILALNFDIVKYEEKQITSKWVEDFWFQTRDGKTFTVEFKTQGIKGGNVNANFVSLERWDDFGSKRIGCIDRLKEDFILFYWPGRDKCCYLLMHAQKLKQWWVQNRNCYEERFNGNSYYSDGSFKCSSTFSKVPVSDFPSSFIIDRKMQFVINDFGRDWKWK